MKLTNLTPEDKTALKLWSIIKVNHHSVYSNTFFAYNDRLIQFFKAAAFLGITGPK